MLVCESMDSPTEKFVLGQRLQFKSSFTVRVTTGFCVMMPSEKYECHCMDTEAKQCLICPFKLKERILELSGNTDNQPIVGISR